MASGVTVNQVVNEKYNEMKLGKHKPAWLIATLNDAKTEVVLDDSLPAPVVDSNTFDEAPNREHFKALQEWIADEKPRYIVFDFRFMKEGQKVSKLGFISWCSDLSPVRLRMVHSATNNTVKKVFDGACDFQVSAKDEFDYEEFHKEICKKV